MKKKEPLIKNPSFQAILTSLLCIILGLLIGYIVLLLINPAGAGEAIKTILLNFLSRSSHAARMKALGNTLAKTALGITDTPVLMAAKAHLRNNKPLVISISTNDGLGANLKNIGLLLNTKNIYFVPFGQDDYRKKPNSLVADTGLLLPTLEQALEQQQYQPLLTTITAT